MRYFLISLILLLLPFTVLGQENDIITISSQGSVNLPADIIRFTININADENTPEKAYNLHKKKEAVLVDLLKKFEIKEENINFEPISVSKKNLRQNNAREENIYQTIQSVIVNIDDFEAFEKMQVALIENGFDNFKGDFLSSQTEKGKDLAIKQAIENAKEKANLIANEAGIKIGEIEKILYSDRRNWTTRGGLQEVVVTSENNLMQYKQVVTVTADITIKFQIMR